MMTRIPNFIRSPSPPKPVQGAMKTRSRKVGVSEMTEGERVGTVTPTPRKPKDVLTPKRPR